MPTTRLPSLRLEHCPVCSEYPGVGVFCSECGVLISHPESGDFAAPYLRRLAGELLDLALFLLLPVWLFWMWRSARDGQSPAKSLLNLHVVDEAGQPITAQRMWMRELVIKRLLLGLIGYGFSLLGPIINAGWILMNPDRQCVHDRMVGTLVVVRRATPSPARASAEPSVAELQMPPPAPSGPRMTPASPRRQGSLASQTGVASAPSAAPSRARERRTSPELEALEGERERLSQTEYERRRRQLLRQLEGSSERK